MPDELEASPEIIAIESGEKIRPDDGEIEAAVAVARTAAKAFVVSARDSATAIRQASDCLRARRVEPKLVLDLNVPSYSIEPGCLPDDVPAGSDGFVCEMGELFLLRHEDAEALAQVLNWCREIYTDTEPGA